MKKEENREEDWYCRYQRQKKQDYDDFMKKMEDDPIGMLFGKRWANWIEDVETKLANTSAPNIQQAKSPGRDKAPASDMGYARETSNVKPFGQNDTDKKSPESIIAHQSQEQEYVIDPITNRKVPRLSPKLKTPTPSIVGSRNSAQGPRRTIDIPVKSFMPSIDSPCPNAQPNLENKSTTPVLDHQHHKQWLAREGFGLQREIKPNPPSPLNPVDSLSQAATSRIESALDRHLQAKSHSRSEPKGPALRYDPKENTTEDVDLLRPSDVRASAGLRGKAPKENEVDKQVRQRKLEEEYESRDLEREKQLAKEVAAESLHQDSRLTRDLAANAAPAGSMRVLKKELTGCKATPIDWVNELSDMESASPLKSIGTVKQSAEAAINQKADKIKAQIAPLKARLDVMKSEYDALRQRWLDEKRRKEEKAAKKARDMHEEEVNAQKVAMDALEVRGVESTSKHSTAVGDNTSRDGTREKPARRQLQSLLPGEGDMASNVHEFANRDRWYKRKAPHANDELDAKLQRLSKDRALIQEVRAIYEDTYGTIDTNHRQPLPGDEEANPVTTHESVISAASTWTEKVVKFGQDASGVENSPEPMIDRSLGSSHFKPLSIYRILTFDANKEEIISSKATSLAPFQSLLPVESLRSLNNAGKFLPDLVTLHNKGFTLVAGASDILVFQKPANAQEFDDSEREHTNALRNQQHDDHRQLVLPASASLSPPTSTSTPLGAAETVSAQTATSESAKSESAAPSQVENLPSSSRVRREEAVFSGRSRGTWQESERRRSSKKHKRAQKQARRSRLKNVLLTGTLTAACCYAVGVVSQMMQH